MAASTIGLDIRGLLDAQAQLALLELPPKLRRRLLNNLGKRVRSMSRKRIRTQQNLDGSHFAPRRDTTAGKKKMETGLGKLLQVTSVTPDKAVLGWKNNLTGWVASQQHNGASERRTAQQMRQWNSVEPGAKATEKQAKRLRLLGFRVRQAGKKKLSRPPVAWIVANVSYMQAGVLIRVLDTERSESTGAQSWEIKLPKRQFLGSGNEQENRELLNTLLDQITNSPR
ncbi:phage virion morphogenesis protein [Pseudomonas sp. SWRI51]|uniref:phage virion morphogenesis protein n=1 Tax=Pseudomonas sp. SWRI51 TaxID=2745491 RepID=UPI001646DF5F|nr:phage virion morphogenesis protein [Pseudomonas sp. SWRI51]MBC3410081.1 phage virion morphogenesis protein [Pseudomonas sp. SWRI51]